MSFLAPWNWPGILARVTGLENADKRDDYMDVDYVVEDKDGNVVWMGEPIEEGECGVGVDDEIESEEGFVGIDPNAQLVDDGDGHDDLGAGFNAQLIEEEEKDVDPIHEALIHPEHGSPWVEVNQSLHYCNVAREVTRYGLDVLRAHHLVSALFVRNAQRQSPEPFASRVYLRQARAAASEPQEAEKVFAEVWQTFEDSWHEERYAGLRRVVRELYDQGYPLEYLSEYALALERQQVVNLPQGLRVALEGREPLELLAEWAPYMTDFFPKDEPLLREYNELEQTNEAAFVRLFSQEFRDLTSGTEREDQSRTSYSPAVAWQIVNNAYYTHSRDVERAKEWLRDYMDNSPNVDFLGFWKDGHARLLAQIRETWEHLDDEDLETLCKLYGKWYYQHWPIGWITQTILKLHKKAKYTLVDAAAHVDKDLQVHTPPGQISEWQSEIPNYRPSYAVLDWVYELNALLNPDASDSSSDTLGREREPVEMDREEFVETFTEEFVALVRGREGLVPKPPAIAWQIINNFWANHAYDIQKTKYWVQHHLDTNLARVSPESWDDTTEQRLANDVRGMFRIPEDELEPLVEDIVRWQREGWPVGMLYQVLNRLMTGEPRPADWDAAREHLQSELEKLVREGSTPSDYLLQWIPELRTALEEGGVTWDANSPRRSSFPTADYDPIQREPIEMAPEDFVKNSAQEFVDFVNGNDPDGRRAILPSQAWQLINKYYFSHSEDVTETKQWLERAMIRSASDLRDDTPLGRLRKDVRFLYGGSPEDEQKLLCRWVCEKYREGWPVEWLFDRLHAPPPPGNVFEHDYESAIVRVQAELDEKLEAGITPSDVLLEWFPELARLLEEDAASGDSEDQVLDDDILDADNPDNERSDIPEEDIEERPDPQISIRSRYCMRLLDTILSRRNHQNERDYRYADDLAARAWSDSDEFVTWLQQLRDYGWDAFHANLLLDGYRYVGLSKKDVADDIEISGSDHYRVVSKLDQYFDTFADNYPGVEYTETRSKALELYQRGYTINFLDACLEQLKRQGINVCNWPFLLEMARHWNCPGEWLPLWSPRILEVFPEGVDDVGIRGSFGITIKPEKSDKYMIELRFRDEFRDLILEKGWSPAEAWSLVAGAYEAAWHDVPKTRATIKELAQSTPERVMKIFASNRDAAVVRRYAGADETDLEELLACYRSWYEALWPNLYIDERMTLTENPGQVQDELAQILATAQTPSSVLLGWLPELREALDEDDEQRRQNDLEEIEDDDKMVVEGDDWPDDDEDDELYTSDPEYVDDDSIELMDEDDENVEMPLSPEEEDSLGHELYEGKRRSKYRRPSAAVRRANAEFEANHAPASGPKGKRLSKVQYVGEPDYRSPETSPKVPSALRQVIAPLRPSLKPQFGAPSAIHPHTPRGLHRRRSSALRTEDHFDINAPLNLNSPFAALKSPQPSPPKVPSPIAPKAPSPKASKTPSPTAPKPPSPTAPSTGYPAYSPTSPVYSPHEHAEDSSSEEDPPRPAVPQRATALRDLAYSPTSPVYSPHEPVEDSSSAEDSPRPAIPRKATAARYPAYAPTSPVYSPHEPAEDSPRPASAIQGTSPSPDYHSARTSPSSPPKSAVSSSKSANATQSGSRTPSYHTARSSLSSPSKSKTPSPTSTNATKGSSRRSSAGAAESPSYLTALDAPTSPTYHRGLLEDGAIRSPDYPPRSRDAAQASSRRSSYHSARSSARKSPTPVVDPFEAEPLEIDTAAPSPPRSGPGALTFVQSPKHAPTESPPHPATPLGPNKSFDEMFDKRPRSKRSTFKDYRAREVDSLRYKNRLDHPHRLPDTPTRSHLPPSPRRTGPRACKACGRAFRVRKKKGGKTGTKKRASAAATAVVAATTEGPRRSGRVRVKTKKFGT